MPRSTRPLTALELKHLPNGTFNVGGVPGLYIRKSSGKGYYFLRYTSATGRHDFGLGTEATISLSEARKKAFQLRLEIENGSCPATNRLKAREQQRVQLQLVKEEKLRQKRTFENVAEEWIESRVKANYWAHNQRGESNTRSLLQLYAYPIIGSKPISTLTPSDVLSCLAPIWQTKPSSAKKLKSTIFKIFQWAIAMGIRTDRENPADYNGSLGILLEPLSADQKPSENHAACDVKEIPLLFTELQQLRSMSARACEFGILTAARSKAIRYATWDEFDLENGIWTIPVQHDKVKSPYRDRTIYLSEQAIELLKKLPHLIETNLVFFNNRFEALSDTALTMCLRGLHENRLLRDGRGWIDPFKSQRMGKPSVITMHGTARASFRTWAKSDELGNNKLFDQEAVELCLLHSKDDRYRGAYDRAPLAKERQKIMAAWGRYCLSDTCNDIINKTPETPRNTK